MVSPPLLRRLLLTILLLPLLSGEQTDLNSDRAALLALGGAVGRTALQWNAVNSPCTWQGVGCLHNRVVFLRLPGAGLIGEIPVGTIGNLTALRSLSLRSNGLSGRLPADLTGAAQLRKLYLKDNAFYGEIPPVLFSLRNLIRLNLAGNGFTGGISPELNNLSRLETLHLERNQLSGRIPDLNLPKLAQVNLSFNRLNGSVPLKLRKIPASAFMGTSLCDTPLPQCPSKISPAVTGGGGGSELSVGAIAGIVVGSTAVVLILLILLLFLCRSRGWSKDSAWEAAAVFAKPLELAARGKVRGAAAATVAKKPDIEMKLVFFGTVGEPEYDLDDLLLASTEVLGMGDFGTVYKAELEVGTVVAVKRLRDVILAEQNFREKLEAVGDMNHENIVPLRAYYYSKNEKLLVYDYMPMGSLSELLHGNKRTGRTRTCVNWETRISIALSVARGIDYIHSTSPAASHGNIKSTNIFPNKSLNACVSENGLVALVNQSSSPSHVSGYRAPELAGLRMASQKADIYSFGVLLLELLTGKAPEEGADLPRLVQSVLQEEWSTDVLDLDLLRQHDVEEMVRLLQLAMNCTVQHPENRPSMAEVVAQIEVIGSSNRDAVELRGDEAVIHHSL